MAPIRVLCLDQQLNDSLFLRAKLQSDPGITLVSSDNAFSVTKERMDVSLAQVAVIEVGWPLSESLNAIHAVFQRQSDIRVVVLAEQASSDTLFQLLCAGVHGILLAETASHRVAAAIRAVCEGGTYVSNDVANIIIPYYLDQRGAKPVASPLDRLSSRERQVLTLVLDGTPSSEIAEQLDISPKSVTTYRSRMMKKLGIKDVPSLVKFAIQHDLISPGVR